MTEKFRWVSIPRSTGSLITLPSQRYLLEHPLGNLGRHCLVLLGQLHQLVEFAVRDDGLIRDELLAHHI